MANARRIGRFHNDAARARYVIAYENALAAWPERPAPIDVETRYGHTHVLATGPTGGSPSGSPIILIHAVAVASPSWYANIAALAVDHPVYAVDTIGDVGLSTQTASVRTRADMSAWLDDVLAGLEVRGAHLVGLSYGGWVVLNQACGTPERVASVTSVDPIGAIGRAQATFLLKIVPDSILASVAKSDHALYRLLRLLNNGTTPAQPLLDLSVAGLRTFRGKQPYPRRLSDEDLQGIRTPTLVLFCGRSPVNHAERASQRSRDLIPGVVTEVIADSGHMLPVEQPARFTSRLLDFIHAVDSKVRTP